MLHELTASGLPQRPSHFAQRFFLCFLTSFFLLSTQETVSKQDFWRYCVIRKKKVCFVLKVQAFQKFEPSTRQLFDSLICSNEFFELFTAWVIIKLLQSVSKNENNEKIKIQRPERYLVQLRKRWQTVIKIWIIYFKVFWEDTFILTSTYFQTTSFLAILQRQ